MTSVSVASNTEECALPITSRDTIWSSLYCMKPLSLPEEAAFLKASLTDSFVAGLLRMTVRSTMETSCTGTRMAQPFSLPLSCGSTRPIALAAPVEDGIMDTAAARARRMSECRWSSRFWSLV